MERYSVSLSSLIIIVFLLSMSEAELISRERPDNNLSRDVSMENHETPLGIDPEQVTHEEFKFDKHVSNEFSVRNEVGLDELSQCIRAGQEKGPLERWMDCFNSLASQVRVDSNHVLFSPKTQSSFMEEENGIQFLTVEEQREKEKAGEESDTLEFSVCVSGMQRSPAKFLHSSTEGENIMSEITEHDTVQADGIVGMKESESVINNKDNADSELQTLDGEEHEARNMENSAFEYLKLAVEIESDGSSLEKSEHADTSGVRKLLQRSDFDHVSPSPKTQISSTEEENGAKVSILEEQREKQKVEEDSDTLEAFVCVNGMHTSSAEFPSSSAEGENTLEACVCVNGMQTSSAEFLPSSTEGENTISEIMGMTEAGSIINNNDNADSQLPFLEEEEHEVPNTENLEVNFLKLPLEVESDGPNIEKLEDADSRRVQKLLRR